MLSCAERQWVAEARLVLISAIDRSTCQQYGILFESTPEDAEKVNDVNIWRRPLRLFASSLTGLRASTRTERGVYPINDLAAPIGAVMWPASSITPPSPKSMTGQRVSWLAARESVH